MVKRDFLPLRLGFQLVITQRLAYIPHLPRLASSPLLSIHAVLCVVDHTPHNLDVRSLESCCKIGMDICVLAASPTDRAPIIVEW
jgi:hypothetical protein